MIDESYFLSIFLCIHVLQVVAAEERKKSADRLQAELLAKTAECEKLVNAKEEPSSSSTTSPAVVVEASTTTDNNTDQQQQQLRSDLEAEQENSERLSDALKQAVCMYTKYVQIFLSIFSLIRSGGR